MISPCILHGSPTFFPFEAFLTLLAVIDRTLKGIGVVDAAPNYESLPGFQR